MFQNVLSESKHSEWKVMRHYDEGDAYIVQKHRLKATFSENLELALFPFDIQVCSWSWKLFLFLPEQECFLQKHYTLLTFRFVVGLEVIPLFT